MRGVTGQFRTLLVGLTGLARLTPSALARFAPSRLGETVSSLRKLHTDFAWILSASLKGSHAFLHDIVRGTERL